ncbi:MAG: histidine phosphatase family protein [Sterolibacterium sp.]
MELLLWRHAEALDATPGQSDQKRRLTARGERQARNVAGWLRAHYQKPLSILVSPAIRCQQTAHPLELPFDIEPRIGTAADVVDLLTAAAWPDGGGANGGAVLLIGHQPTLGRLAALLLSGRESDWSFKKGALWWFSNRPREGEMQAVLKAVIAPDLA